MKKLWLVRFIAVILAAFFLGWFVINMLREARTERVGYEDGLGGITENHISIPDYEILSSQFNSRKERSADEDINISVYDTRNKSVVNVTTEVLAYNWFFEPVPKEGGIGSGSIIDKKGYVLTNYHVIEDATRVYVTLWNGEKKEGDVIGIDRENDLAIIKIDPKGEVLVPIPVGDSNSLKVGQKTLAIGNPFGLDRTLTVGIVSGLGRPVRSSTNIVIQNMVQTDASINPGNSGGPLLNSEGEMIGVNTIIVSPSRGSVGVGFAVPAETVKRIIPDLIEHGKVLRGWVEWNIRPLFPELVKYAEMSVSQGLLVTAVAKGSNADKGGIQGGNDSQRVRYGRTIIPLGGDVIVTVNKLNTSSISDYLKALEQTRPGDVIEIEYFRKGKRRSTKITLSQRPKDLVID